MRLNAENLRRWRLIRIVDLSVERSPLSVVKVVHSCIRSLFGVMNHDISLIIWSLLSWSGILNERRTVDGHLDSPIRGKFLHRMSIFGQSWFLRHSP